MIWRSEIWAPESFTSEIAPPVLDKLGYPKSTLRFWKSGKRTPSIGVTVPVPTVNEDNLPEFREYEVGLSRKFGNV